MSNFETNLRKAVEQISATKAKSLSKREILFCFSVRFPDGQENENIEKLEFIRSQLAIIPTFLSAIYEAPIISSSLVYVCKHDADRAQLSQEFDNVSRVFNDFLMQNDAPNWLCTYLKDKDMGGAITSSFNAANEMDLASILIQKIADRKSQTAWKAQDWRYCEEAASATAESLRLSMASFLESNWEGLGDRETIEQVTTHIMTLMHDRTKEFVQLDRFPCQQLLFALESRVRFLSGLGETSYPDLERPDYAKSKRDAWETGSKAIESYLRSMERTNTAMKSEGKIQPRDFGLFIAEKLSRDDVVSSQKEMPQYGNLQKVEGLCFRDPNDFTYNLSVRLSYHHLAYSLQEQGISLLRSLSGALAAYYLKVIECKQEMFLELSLIAYSTHMTHFKRDQQSLLISVSRLTFTGFLNRLPIRMVTAWKSKAMNHRTSSIPNSTLSRCVVAPLESSSFLTK